LALVKNRINWWYGYASIPLGRASPIKRDLKGRSIR
jgi:hypothetical protein